MISVYVLCTYDMCTLRFLIVAVFISWKQASHVREVLSVGSPQWTGVGCHKVPMQYYLIVIVCACRLIVHVHVHL